MIRVCSENLWSHMCTTLVFAPPEICLEIFSLKGNLTYLAGKLVFFQACIFDLKTTPTGSQTKIEHVLCATSKTTKLS